MIVSGVGVGLGVPGVDDGLGDAFGDPESWPVHADRKPASTAKVTEYTTVRIGASPTDLLIRL